MMALPIITHAFLKALRLELAHVTLKFPMSLEISLPDGSKQPVPPGTRPIDIAQSISPRLADAAIVAKVNGELYDLTRPFESNATLQILTNKDPEALQVYRH